MLALNRWSTKREESHLSTNHCHLANEWWGLNEGFMYVKTKGRV